MRRNILVVDDNVDLVRIAQALLKFQGYEVLTASGGAEALTQLAQSRPDLMILDIMMPGMNGLEVLKQIRENPGLARLPVILLSVKAQDEDILLGYRSGADYYLPKPSTLKQLLYAIEHVLGT